MNTKISSSSTDIPRGIINGSMKKSFNHENKNLLKKALKILPFNIKSTRKVEMNTKNSSLSDDILREIIDGSIELFSNNDKVVPTKNDNKKSLENKIARLPSNIKATREVDTYNNLINLEFFIEQEHFDIKVTISLYNDKLIIVIPKGIYKQQQETTYYFDNMEYIDKNNIRGLNGNITKVNLVNEFDADTKLMYAVPVHAVEIEEGTYQIIPLMYRKIKHRHISFDNVDERFDVSLFDIQGRKPYNINDPKYKFFNGLLSKQDAEIFIRGKFSFGK